MELGLTNCVKYFRFCIVVTHLTKRVDVQLESVNAVRKIKVN